MLSVIWWDWPNFISKYYQIFFYMSPSRWIKNSDLKNRNERLLHVLCLCVCVISEIASILIDLNCAGTIGTGAPESPSTQRRWNVNMFQSLIGLQTTGPLLVRSEQLLLPWWDVRVNLCVRTPACMIGAPACCWTHTPKTLVRIRETAPFRTDNAIK